MYIYLNVVFAKLFVSLAAAKRMRGGGEGGGSGGDGGGAYT